jgi:hypothetical protein
VSHFLTRQEFSRTDAEKLWEEYHVQGRIDPVGSSERWTDLLEDLGKLKCLHSANPCCEQQPFWPQRELWPQIFWPQIFKTQFCVSRPQILCFLAPNSVLFDPIFFCLPPVAIKRKFSRHLRFLGIKVFWSCVL